MKRKKLKKIIKRQRKLQDRFAGFALMGLIATSYEKTDPEDTALLAHEHAEAMMTCHKVYGWKKRP